MSSQQNSKGKVRKMAEAIDNESRKSRIEEWVKHHEHAADFLEDTGEKDQSQRHLSEERSSAAAFRKRGRGHLADDSSVVEEIDPDDEASDLDENEDDDEDEEWQMVTEEGEHFVEEIEDEEDEPVEDVSDTEIRSLVLSESGSSSANDQSSENGSLSFRITKENKDAEISVDVAAVAAMVGGFACALFYAWKGKGKAAKESLEIFSRGFGKMCDKM